MDNETLSKIERGTKHHAKAFDRKEAYSAAYRRINELEKLAIDAHKAIQEISARGFQMNGSFIYSFESKFRRIVER